MNKREYPAMTVNDLYLACEKQIKDGNGNKKIMISTDDEGNGYHGLFYTFTSDEDVVAALSDLFHDPVVSGTTYGFDLSTKDIVLLG